MQDCTFVKLNKCMHIDEAYFIYSARMKCCGLPAFQGARGRLAEFHIKLAKGVPIQVLFRMQPPHIKKTMIEHLLFNKTKICSIKLMHPISVAEAQLSLAEPKIAKWSPSLSLRDPSHLVWLMNQLPHSSASLAAASRIYNH